MDVELDARHDGRQVRGFAIRSVTVHARSNADSSNRRGPKAAQILSDNASELVWWHTPTQHQFRVRARAFILPPAGHTFVSLFPGTELSPR